MLNVTKYLRVDSFEDNKMITETVFNDGKRGQRRDVVVKKKTFPNIFNLAINAFGYDCVHIDVNGGMDKGPTAIRCYPDVERKRKAPENLISERKICVRLNGNSYEDQIVKVRGIKYGKRLCGCLLLKGTKQYSAPITIVVQTIIDANVNNNSSLNYPPPPPPPEYEASV